MKGENGALDRPDVVIRKQISVESVRTMVSVYDVVYL